MEETQEDLRIKDVSPDELSDPTLTPPPGGSSVATSAPDLPKKPGLFEKITGLLKSDPDIQKKEAEIKRINLEAAEKVAALEQEIVADQAAIAARARRADPAVRAEEKRQKALYDAETLEARRLAKLIEVVDEAIRRKPPTPDRVEWARSQLRNYKLLGLFSRPPKRG